MKIKLLGHGAVVQSFLHLYHDIFPDIKFKVYSRSPQNTSGFSNVKFQPIDVYEPEDTTICCLSVNEEQILKQNASFSKLDVARPNLDLLNQLIQRGYFASGTHMIVTTPNELIAEHIIRLTNNKHIYALGLSVDAERYRQLLPDFNIPSDVTYDVLGNHYQSPVINFHDQRFDNEDLIADLMAGLASKIRSEFTGFRPPIHSGVKAIYDAVYGLYHQQELTVAGYSYDVEAVVGGKFNPVTHDFYQPEVNPSAQEFLHDAIQKHKKCYQQLIGERS